MADAAAKMISLSDNTAADMPIDLLGQRRPLLASTVDRAPLPTPAEVGTWTMPRDIDSLDYFGPASDACRAYASLADLNRQPGLAYLATTGTGTSYVVTVLAENPSQPLGDDAIPTVLSTVKGAFTLAARG